VHPILILVVSIAVVFALIIKLKINAFFALILAAMSVGLMACVPYGGDPSKVTLGAVMGAVTSGFGTVAGKIAIVIAMASLIGHCLMESGAADKIVRRFVGVLGEKNASLSMLVSGYVLSIPVFFDTVFFLLVPLARALRVRTGKNYLLFVMSICAGGAVTHCMVPPTPGPLTIATTLGLDMGTVILTGMIVGIPMALAGWAFSKFMDARMPIELREVPGMSLDEVNKLASKDESQLPSFWVSMLPIVLPVLMISANTVVGAHSEWKKGPLAPWAQFLGNADFALIVSAVVAMVTLAVRKGYTLARLGEVLEPALASAGMIILITAAGGAYGAMLKVAGVGDALGAMAKSWGMSLITLGFFLSAILKIAQGSSTVAMITVSSIVAPMIAQATLTFHPVYIGLSIASGSLVGSWMNDSGFWVYKQMSGLTEPEALKTWTPLLIILGVAGFLGCLAGTVVCPMPLAKVAGP
jgi:GntP family gluconate:H+ symporter